MKCHFVIKGHRIECSFKLHKKLNYSISHRINHLWLPHVQACTNTFVSLISHRLLFWCKFTFILKCKHNKIYLKWISFFWCDGQLSHITTPLKLMKTSARTRIAMKLPCVCWDWQENCCITWDLIADLQRLRSPSTAEGMAQLSGGGRFEGGRRTLAKLRLAATLLEHNLCLCEVCNPSFKIFWRAQSKTLPAQCCLCRRAGERRVAVGTAHCAIATPRPSQALPPQSARPASASHCISTCCFSPPPQLCPMSAAQQGAGVPAQERAWGRRGDASLSCKSLRGERAPKAAFLPRSPCRTAPTSLQREREKTSKFHDERWRERSLSLVLWSLVRYLG